MFTVDYKHVSRTNRNLKSESTLTVCWLNYKSFIPGMRKGILKYLTTTTPNKWQGDECWERPGTNKTKHSPWRKQQMFPFKDNYNWEAISDSQVLQSSPSFRGCFKRIFLERHNCPYVILKSSWINSLRFARKEDTSEKQSGHLNIVSYTVSLFYKVVTPWFIKVTRDRAIMWVVGQDV